MPEEYPEYHEPTPGNQETQTPEDINIDQVKDPEAGLSMTMRGENDWQNKLDPTRMAAEGEMVLHLAEVIPVGDQPAEISEVAPLPTQPGVDNIAPVADIPEKTAEEQIEAGKDLIDYQAELTYDIANPENVKYSPEQEKNNEIMEGLLKKYPHAFIQREADDGKKYSLLKTIVRPENYPPVFGSILDSKKMVGGDKVLIFSYNGLTLTNRHDTNIEKYDYSPLLNIKYVREILIKGANIHLSTLDSAVLTSSDRLVANIDSFECKNIKDANLEILKMIIADTEQQHINDVEPQEQTALDILNLL